MPETFSAAFEAPIVENIGGQQVEFPVLEIDDYLPWSAKLKAKRRADGQKKIPANATQFDRWQAEQYMDKNEPWLDDIALLVKSIIGAKEVLHLSLAKAGRTDEAERSAIIKAIRPHRVVRLAEDVSRLFPPIYSLPESHLPNLPAGQDAGETGSQSND